MTAALSPLPGMLPETGATPPSAGAAVPGEFAAVLGDQAGPPVQVDAGASALPQTDSLPLPPLPGDGNVLPPALAELLPTSPGPEQQNLAAALTGLPPEAAEQAAATVVRAQSGTAVTAASPAVSGASPETLATLPVPRGDPQPSLDPARPVVPIPVVPGPGVPGAMVQQVPETIRPGNDRKAALVPRAPTGTKTVDLGPILAGSEPTAPAEETSLPSEPRQQAVLAALAGRATTPSAPFGEVPAQSVPGVSAAAPAVADGGSTPAMAKAGAASLEPGLALGQAGWREALAERVTVMAETGTNAARLRLHPEHLGPLEVRVTVVDDKATVWFGTHSTTVREALESALPRLRDMLDATGLELGEASVSQRESDRSTPEQVPTDLWAREPELSQEAETVTMMVPQGRLLDAYA